MKTTITILGIIVLFITSCGVTENITNDDAYEKKIKFRSFDIVSDMEIAPINGITKSYIEFYNESDQDYIKIVRSNMEIRKFDLFPKIIIIEVQETRKERNGSTLYVQTFWGGNFNGVFYQVIQYAPSTYVVETNLPEDKRITNSIVYYEKNVIPYIRWKKYH